MRTTAIAIMLLLAGCCAIPPEPKPDREIRYYFEVAPVGTWDLFGNEKDTAPDSPNGAEEAPGLLSVGFRAEFWIDDERSSFVLGVFSEAMTPQGREQWRRGLEKRLEEYAGRPDMQEFVGRAIKRLAERTVEAGFSSGGTTGEQGAVLVVLESGGVAVGRLVPEGVHLSARIQAYEPDAETGRIKVSVGASAPDIGVVEYSGVLSFRTGEPIELKKVPGSYHLMPVLAQSPTEAPENGRNQSEGNAVPES